MQPVTHSALVLFLIFFLSFFSDQVAAAIGDNAWAAALVALIAYGVFVI